VFVFGWLLCKHPAMAPWGVPTSDQAVIDAQR
jgi:hypothetical protein